MTRFILALAVSLSALSAATPSAATAQLAPTEPTMRDIVVAYNTGLRFSIAPGVFLPKHGQAGFSIAGDIRYGFEVGPTVIAPGLRLAGYFPSGFMALTALATTRVTVPIGPVGPYVLGGVGPGYIDSPSDVGFAYQVGGGLMVHIGDSFGLGAEATFLAITGTYFSAWFIGPSLLLGF